MKLIKVDIGRIIPSIKFNINDISSRVKIYIDQFLDIISEGLFHVDYCISTILGAMTLRAEIVHADIASTLFDVIVIKPIGIFHLDYSRDSAEANLRMWLLIRSYEFDRATNYAKLNQYAQIYSIEKIIVSFVKRLQVYANLIHTDVSLALFDVFVRIPLAVIHADHSTKPPDKKGG